MNMKTWMAKYCRRIEEAFGSRIRFIGLQGSRARGEENENSDFDVVCILDALSLEDIIQYRAALEGMEKRELLCGFLSGWDELMRWNPAELFMFYFDTIPYSGSLDILKEKIDASAVEKAVRSGAEMVYHGCVHNMVHARDMDVLRGLYKSAVFALRAAVYLRSGRYVSRLDDLLKEANADEMAILQTHIALKNGADADFDLASEKLFAWAQNILK